MKSGAEWLWVLPIRTCASSRPVSSATLVRTSRVIRLPMPGRSTMLMTIPPPLPSTANDRAKIGSCTPCAGPRL
jgi:hypothetical protein